MAQSLEYFRSVSRVLTARAVGSRAPGLIAGPLAPLRLVNRSDPEPSTRRMGPHETVPVGHLRQRPVHDRGAFLVLLLAAGVAAVRARPRGRRRAARRLRRAQGRAARRGDLERAGVRGARAARPVPQLRGRRLRPVRPRHGGRSEAGSADRVLRRHRRRLEPDDAGAPFAGLGGALGDGRPCRGARRAAGVRDPFGVPRERPRRRRRDGDRGGHGGHPHLDRAAPVRQPGPGRSRRPSTRASGAPRRWPAPTRWFDPSTP